MERGLFPFSVFQVQLPFNKCSINAYEANADIKSAHEAIVLREYFNPS